MSDRLPGPPPGQTAPVPFRGPRLAIRGPAVAPGGVACLGGAETYGRFVADPFPAQLGRITGRTVANMGAAHAGVDSFLRDPGLIAAARRSAMCVLQVAGAERLSNPLYSVHPRRADRFIAATERLRQLAPAIDLSEVHFTRHLLHVIRDECPVTYVTVIEELQATWVARMARLIADLGGPVCLLWISARRPGEAEWDITGPDPLFVTQAMIDRLAPSLAGVVQYRVPVNTSGELLPGQSCSEKETPAALRQPGPDSHAAIARALANVVDQTLSVSSGTASNRSATSP